MSSKHNLYTGRSGQLAVIAEFLRRGYNAAIPEIDVGEDVFVIRDRDGELSRVQVKSAIGKGDKKIGANFNLSRRQLETPAAPELFYVFAVYHHDAWREFVVIRRDVLRKLRATENIGNVRDERITFYLSFSDDDVRCGQVSMGAFRGDWQHWPMIQH